MTFSATLTPVATTAVKLAANPSRTGMDDDVLTRHFVLKNATGTAPIFLGAAGVTATSGFRWDPADGRLDIELEPGEEIWAVVVALTQTVHVLSAGR